jgi:hypothetical protein
MPSQYISEYLYTLKERETKIFITAYKLAERSVDEYLTTGIIGSN